MTITLECFECGATVAADDLRALGDGFLAHAREAHEWPYPDQAIRNYAEANQRLTGPTDRLPVLGEVTIRPVTEDLLDQWLAFFDHDGFVGNPEWAACYCLEPHVREPNVTSPEPEPPHWRENREAMAGRLRGGQSFGYLAHVDGRAAGWVNASKRSDYALYRMGAGADPPDGDVVGVACFVIAPPYRRHGLAGSLLDRVLTDAPERGVAAVEAYPFNEGVADDARNFRGARSMYDARGFVLVEQRERDSVVRRTFDSRHAS